MVVFGGVSKLCTMASDGPRATIPSQRSLTTLAHKRRKKFGNFRSVIPIARVAKYRDRPNYDENRNGNSNY